MNFANCAYQLALQNFENYQKFTDFPIVSYRKKLQYMQKKTSNPTENPPTIKQTLKLLHNPPIANHFLHNPLTFT